MVSRDKELNRFRMGWLAIMVGLAVSGVTVHFWNALFAYFFFLIGTGVWMTRPVTHHSKIMLLARLAATLPPQPVLKKQH